MTRLNKSIYAIALTALTCFNIQAAENKTHLVENIKHETTQTNEGVQHFVFSNIEYCQLKNSKHLDNYKLRRYERHFIQLGGTEVSISNDVCSKVKKTYERLSMDQVDKILEEKFY